ncbi:tetratricopeptide repeat-containing diguanylate cyclase [Shewanella cyperi]|uniref:tetratricopeptide repeat-containing diguanylate cyclase n=1 Tax=Shewanella cyperi TaxID=2814292 RepID=UPI001A94C437|nr:GGDEF domain-containing protein [Shewanella cyperi]QSX39767.1 GGDEF domain-containing protein [Shewanella cyperi]
MIKYLFFIAALLVSTCVAAENYDQALDELEGALQSQQGNVDILFDNLAADYAKMTADQKARFLMFSGMKDLFGGDYQRSLESLNSALNLTNSLPLVSQILVYQATGYILKREFSSALDKLQKNLSLIENLKDRGIQTSTYVRLAGLYYQMELYEDVGLFANRALKLVSEDDTKNTCYAKLYVGAYAIETNQLQQALSAFADTRAYCGSHALPLVVAMASKGEGRARSELGDFDEAERLLLQALAGYTKFGYQMEMGSAHSLLAKNYWKSGNLEKAKYHANMTIETNASDVRAKQMAYEVLASLYADSGDYAKAYSAQTLEQKFRQELLDGTKAKAQAYEAAKFNAVEQQREIALLNKEREQYLAQQNINERERSNSLMFSIIFFGSSLFLLIMLLAGGIQRNKYKRLSQRDGLTGVFNRSTGQEFAENRLIQLMARNQPFSLILLDLDSFKQINDSFGHGTGDWALKKVVEVLIPLLHPDDILARFGGEEFFIALPGAGVDKALEVAERCRLAIESIDTHYSGHTFELTASFGVTSLMEDDLSLDPLLHRADLALYQAKNSGRNQICVELGKKGSPKSAHTPSAQSLAQTGQ